ncbi:MAG: TauD/TfdA family dioxygenase [Caldilineaceae bacterium]|nr:TauD/TfdA family dioxygenase [Caldilineaceae bacterium]
MPRRSGFPPRTRHDLDPLLCGAPASGGDTYWSSGYAGYETLDPQTQARIANLSAVYVHRNPAYNPPTPPVHPLVCVHPETRRKTLFLSPSSAQSVVGLDEQSGRALLDELYAHATQPQFVWRHQWRPGDLIMWDNRCTMHRRDSFDDSQRRYMRRTQVLGPITMA